MNEEIRFKGGQKPGNSGFATPHVAGIPEDEPDEAVNDSFGSVHPADTMDTEPDKDSEAGGRKSARKWRNKGRKATELSIPRMYPSFLSAPGNSTIYT